MQVKAFRDLSKSDCMSVQVYQPVHMCKKSPCMWHRYAAAITNADAGTGVLAASAFLGQSNTLGVCPLTTSRAENLYLCTNTGGSTADSPMQAGFHPLPLTAKVHPSKTMKLLTSFLLVLATVGHASAVLPPKLQEFTQSAIDSGLVLKTLNGIALAKTFSSFSGTCTPSNVKFRREWRSISRNSRKKFVEAVKCVQTKPSVLPPSEVPGAKSVYDDLVWAHIRKAGLVHNSGTFLLFHRYYLYAYEQELAKCGWKSGVPYWNWGLDINGPHLSPVFDGSDASLGSDGIFIPNQPDRVIHFTPTLSVVIPPGTGGGCVASGPFSDFTIRLGIFSNLTGMPVEPVDGRGDNPRCLERDLNGNPLRRWSSFRNTTEVILSHDNIWDFQTHIEGDPRFMDSQLELMGPHGGGHAGIGGVAGNPIISPYDPAFWLTHSQLDRIYWIWQMLDLENRSNVAGTSTWINLPPSPNITVEDTIDVLPHQPTRKLKELMNTVGGSPLCHVYV
ncbi:Grixazone synthase [Podospora australis]|uniref:Grixazone synthase n=1 Tax=Podospora australis TaxID=1536484 RepID=A0AAN6WL79_9PEZI|nr:Grixazone synthase [Podospora australis]